MSTQIRYLAPTGMIGGGFTEEYFEAALGEGIEFIAVDSGSTDGGPSYLGADRYFMSRDVIKRDLRLLVIAARKHDIPLLIGSCGGSGGNWNLNWMWEITKEIAAEEALHFRVALIPAEPDREALVEKYRQGRIRPLHPAPEIDETTFTDTRRIVAMMGTEPYIAALEGGADIVLAGRSSDAALFAAIPVHRGFPAGLAWHAAKIMECGGAAVDQMKKPEGMICTITQDYFELKPVSPEQTCSPISVASHALYETSNPYVMHEPGGVMHLENVSYEAVGNRAVRVRGSGFERAPYTVKLEGAAVVGYRSQVLGGITDPMILRDFDTWFEAAKTSVAFTLKRSLGEEAAAQCQVDYRVFGKNAVLGERDSRDFVNHHELGVLLVVVAPTQELASGAAAAGGHAILHFAVPQWRGLVSNLAFPVAPHLTDLGPAYSFVLNHVVELDDPLEFFPVRFEEV